MHLEMCFLADAVASTPDGKFFIHGGGVTRIFPPVMPWPQALAVFLRFALEPSDSERGHQVDLALTAPTGEAVVDVSRIEIPPLSPAVEEGEEPFVQVALPLGSLAFKALGLHSFTVKLDGELVRTLPLLVKPHAESAAQPVTRPPNTAERRGRDK